MLQSLFSPVKIFKEDTRYRDILITIIAVTVIPVVLINAISHFYTVSKFKESYVNARISQLKQSGTSARELIKHVDTIMNILGQDEEILEFIMNPDESDYQKLAHIHKLLNSFLKGGQSLHSIYIYSKFSGLIISSNGGLHELNDFSDTDWIDDFDTHFLGTRNLDTRKAIIDNKEFNLISFMNNLPLGTWDKVGGIIININESTFYEDTFSSNTTLSRGFIINLNGKILSHSNKDLLGQYYWGDGSRGNKNIQFFNNGQRIVCYIKDSHSKWGFVLEIDVREVVGSVRHYLIMMTAVLVFIIGFILLLDIHLSQEFYLPVKLLGDSLKDFEYAKPLIEGKILNNIVQNRYSSEKDIQSDLSLIHMNLDGSACLILLIDIDKYQELLDTEEYGSLASLKMSLRLRINDLLEESPFQYLYSEVKRDQVCLLIKFPNDALIEQQERLLSLAEKTCSQIAEEFPFTVTIGIGDVYHKIMNLHLSFQEAKNAVSYKLIHGQSRVIQFADVKDPEDHNPGFKSPFEKQIFQAIQLGLKEEIPSHVKNLCIDLRKSENRDIAFITYTIERVMHSLLEKFGSEIESESVTGTARDFIKEFHRLETLGEMEEWIIEFCLILTEENKDSQHSEFNDVAKRIGVYIDQNLSNKNISLVEIGDALGLTPSYISRVFKEYFGYNYLEYLNKNRIDKAKTLLCSGNMAIAEIGGMVGFSSSQSFLRVFQRYEKTSPGRFRKMHQGNYYEK